MKKIYKHIEGVKVTAEFDKNYRYRLDISLINPAQSRKTACVVMQNPSDAGEEIADKSVQFMEKVVFQKNLPEFTGVQRLIVVNQFAHIQTNKFRGLPGEIGSKNDVAIKSALKESDIIILGWGVTNRFKERQAFVRGLIDEMDGKELFVTKKHPSRAGYNGFIIAA
ncbi:MAG TPA: DUF1643 domain-containing protein [Verrucomicrobiae bacterium]|jgi:hypothetical protein|nr:DUF1643 domain-containing protein [Verrucomicrobiae bacterium]